MKVSKKTWASFVIFLMSSLILMILLAQTTALNQMNLFQELTEEDLEWGKNILEQCDLPPERRAEMNEIMFKVEQELFNKNKVNAAKYFNSIRPDLGTCEFKLSGEPHPFETLFGRITMIIDFLSGSIALVSFVRDNFHRIFPKKNS